MEDYIVKINDMTVSYHKKTCIMGCGFENSLGGKLIAIVGPNGAGGKSTLLKATLGLIKPITGRALFWGESYEKQRKRIGYVPPQRGSVDWDFLQMY